MSLMLNSNSDDETLYSDSVFSTYLYTGNGSSQTITNGIDLAGKGGMVWIKQRNGPLVHNLRDTVRGNNYSLISSLTNAQSSGWSTVFNFTSTGYAITGTNDQYNGAGGTYASWTFRKAAKFFDVVTFSPDGSGNATINQSLGSAPGMIYIKKTSSTSDWKVYHRSLATNYGLYLNTTGAAENFGTWIDVSSSQVNFYGLSAGTYVAYLFAHDTSSTGIIQCGSFTTNAFPGNATVNLGWEPQYLMIKPSSAVGPWRVIDTMRGISLDGNDAVLFPNLSDAETLMGTASINATGFISDDGSGSTTYIYMAIRRPNKPPTTGTQVFASTGHNGTGATNDSITFDPVPYIDLTWIKSRNTAGTLWAWTDRLRGATKELDSSTSTASTAETTYANDVTSFAFMSASGQSIRLGSGASGNVNTSSYTYSDIGFKRAPGFFDEVCYTGTGSATTQAHNLGVAPELIIVDCRSNPRNWPVYTGNKTSYLYLNLTDSQVTADTVIWNNTAPTSTNFSLGTYSINNASTYTYVAYLFATLAGISKVGSYTGNGGTQNIDCGFAAGARFVLVKATSTTGDWLVADAARGILSGNDPILSLNSTAAEVTGEDWLDPYAPGFTVNQTTASANASGVSYIFLAIS